LPGQWEFVRKGDPPVVGLTSLNPEKGITFDSLKRPRRAIEPQDKDESEQDMIMQAATDLPPQTVSTTTAVYNHSVPINAMNSLYSHN